MNMNIHWMSAQSPPSCGICYGCRPPPHARIYGLLGAGGREHEHWRSGQVEMRRRRRAAAGEGEWVTR